MSSFVDLRRRRKELISEIESIRNSKLLVYFMGDRPNLGTQMGSDAVRWIYDHLLSMNKEEKVDQIDLYLYSRGGGLEVPWQIITTVRQFCTTLNTLIPYKAHSAGTLLALGSDKILMGRKGELGPIDPQMVVQQQIPASQFPIENIFSVEDITSYISFLREKVGLTDQKALYELAKPLVEKLTPITLGQVNRTQSHIRLVAGKMLSLVKPPLDSVLINQIVESLTEKIYIHGHSIGADEAKEMKMQVEKMNQELEKKCWELFLEYEKLMKLNSYADTRAYFSNESDDEYSEDTAVVACVESLNRYHEFSGKFSLRKKREFTQPVNLTLNVPVQLPSTIDPRTFPANVQEILQNLIQTFQNNAVHQIRNIVNEEIKKQSVIVGIENNSADHTWREVPDNNA